LTPAEPNVLSVASDQHHLAATHGAVYQQLTTTTAGAGATAEGVESLREGGSGGPEDAMIGELKRLCTTSEIDWLEPTAGDVT